MTNEGKMMQEDLLERACWFLLAFETKLPTRIINSIILHWIHEGRTLQDFFATSPQDWSDICQLPEKYTEKLLYIRNNALPPQGIPLPLAQVLLLKQLEREHIHILTLLDRHYPISFKSAFKAEQLLPALCYMGDIAILERQSIAIIGSRNADESSLAFTREIASYLVAHGITIISGNARGVDSAAYEGTISANGYIIIVLPHGIRKLNKVQLHALQPGIDAGHILLLSQFHPDAPWLVSRAMERNKIVTGLAQAVIVAESAMQGGTWEGANGALKQGRPLYVRQTDTSLPLIGNNALIECGGRALPWPTDHIAETLLTVL